MVEKSDIQIVDIFSGIGGFSLAGSWMGWRTVQFCEIDKFCQKILSYYWPDVPIHNDIKTLTAEQIINNGLYDESKTTIFVGGVPCQPWSQAGKRKGTEDDRDLWKETTKLIGKLQPDFCLLENVAGLISWNRGLVFDQVQVDLENEGYQVQPVILPAASINAPHRRDRVWFIAYNSDARIESMQRERENTIHESKDVTNSEDIGHELPGQTWNRGTGSKDGNIRNDVSNPKSKGLERRNRTQEPIRTEQGNKKATTNPDSDKRPQRRLHKEGQKEAKRHISPRNARGNERTIWQNFPTQSPVCSRDDELSARLDNITFPKWRNESIKGYGNAVVPKLVYEIFKVIQQMES